MLLALLVSGALVIGSFVWQGRYGFDIGDEGFLWYGVQRTLAGEFPILDFMAYDPGRYYWSAALTGLLHDDEIIALRAAVAAFQLLGFFLALLLILRDRPRVDGILFALAAVTLLAWMFPRHKLFDVSLSILLIGILTFLAQQPSRRRFFLAGAGVGFVAVFGRNHGLYGVAGLAGVVIYLACLRRDVRPLLADLIWCGCGIVVGYLPILVLAAVVPGFAAAFWESILRQIKSGANLPLPVPWPWLVPAAELPLSTAAAGVLTGVFFIAIGGFGISSMVWIMRRPLRQRPVPPGLVACSVLALPYAHFAFSRADPSHLAQGIFPFLIGVFMLLNAWPNRARWLVALAITGASLLVMVPLHPGWDCRVKRPCVTADVAGEPLTVDKGIAEALVMLKSVADEYAPNGRNFVVVPLWPGAYSVLKRRSPIWEVYALNPQGDELQRREIERIEAANPGFILVLDVAIDGRDDLRFRNTHPLIERFIRDNFDPITIDDWPPPISQFYKGR